MQEEYEIVLIGGSAGSFQPIKLLLEKLPTEFTYSIVLCLHRPKNVKKGFAEALSIGISHTVLEPYDKEKILQNKIYLAPSNYHLLIDEKKTIHLSTEEPVNYSRPSIDLMFESAAYALKDKVVGILYSGANQDGALGMKKIKENNGLTIIQNPNESTVPTMPKSALSVTPIDLVLSSKEICSFLNSLCSKKKKVLKRFLL